MKLKIFLFTLLLSTAALLARAGNPTNGTTNPIKKDIAGGVTHAESKKPIRNVSVTAYSSSKKEKVVVTDNNGFFTFSDLKPGTYKLVFEKDGFKKVIKEKVTIGNTDGCQLNVEMLEETGEFQIMPGQLLFSNFN